MPNISRPATKDFLGQGSLQGNVCDPVQKALILLAAQQSFFHVQTVILHPVFGKGKGKPHPMLPIFPDQPHPSLTLFPALVLHTVIFLPVADSNVA